MWFARCAKKAIASGSRCAAPISPGISSRWGGSGKGIIILDPSAKDSLNASGNGSVTVTGGASVIVDSNSYEAARATGAVDHVRAG